MDVKRIAASEFTVHDEEIKYNIRKVFWPLYCFYKERTQQALYRVVLDNGVQVSDLVDLDYVTFYKRFGVDFSNTDSAVNTRSFVKYLHLSELLDTESFCEHELAVYHDMDPASIGIVFIEYDVDIASISVVQRAQILNAIRTVYASATIANEDFVAEWKSETDDGPEYEKVVKLDSLFKDGELFADTDALDPQQTILKQMLRILEKVHECKGADCIDASDSELISQLNVGNKRALAYVAMIKYGKCLFFSHEIETSTLNFIPDTQHQDAMYAEDYINFLTNLPDIAVVRTVTNPFLVLPDKNASTYSSVDMHVIACEISDDFSEFIGDGNHQQINSDDIEVISMADTYNLSAKNADEALVGMHKLAQLHSRFIKKCSDFAEMKQALLNVSNTLLFKIDDKLYFGYITSINTEKQFIAYPLQHHAKPFMIKLDLRKVALVDIKLYSDWKKIILPFVKSGYVNLQKAFVRPLRYVNGLLLQGLNITFKGEHTMCGLTIEDVGMYDDRCWMLRKSNRILDYLKANKVQEKLATPFGGLHVYEQIQPTIEKEDWRSNADRIQQFNTY